MSTFRLTVEYDGTDFSGWQAQRGRRTVEGVLREAIAALTSEPVTLTAAGRTDAGAHAHGQVVGVSLRGDWRPERLHGALNALLPRDVVVVGAAVASAEFHARHDAARRTYRYLIIARDDRAAVTRGHAWRVRGPLDAVAMRAAAQHLVGRHDFASFGRSPRTDGTTVRTVHDVFVDTVSVRAAGVTRIDAVSITVTADAFLRGMMRAFAGALVAVSQGKLVAADVEQLVARAEHTPRLTVAPAHGLHQWSVSYGHDSSERAA